MASTAGAATGSSTAPATGSSRSGSSRRCAAASLGVPVTCRRLRVAVDDPDGLVDARASEACRRCLSERERTRGTTRSRSLSRAAGLSGLEALQLIAAGELPPPPIAQTLGFGAIEVEEGTATFDDRAGRVPLQPDRRRPRRARARVARLRDGLRRALDAAGRRRVHDARGEGELRAAADVVDRAGPLHRHRRPRRSARSRRPRAASSTPTASSTRTARARC